MILPSLATSILLALSPISGTSAGRISAPPGGGARIRKNSGEKWRSDGILNIDTSRFAYEFQVEGFNGRSGTCKIQWGKNFDGDFELEAGTNDLAIKICGCRKDRWSNWTALYCHHNDAAKTPFRCIDHVGNPDGRCRNPDA